MPAVQVLNEKIGRDNKNSRRRRKKRRTEDFSSDSSSSSSSEESAAEEETTQIEVVKQDDINIDNIDINSDDESKKLAPEPLNNSVHKKLANVKLTTTTLSTSSGFGKNLHSLANSSQIKESLEKDSAKLNNDYLMMMATEFSNDIDELRKKPDFTDKSIVLLAKSLQSGSNMFDKETLSAVMNK